jgi:hypothetical protein
MEDTNRAKPTVLHKCYTKHTNTRKTQGKGKSKRRRDYDREGKQEILWRTESPEAVTWRKLSLVSLSKVLFFSILSQSSSQSLSPMLLTSCTEGSREITTKKESNRRKSEAVWTTSSWYAREVSKKQSQQSTLSVNMRRDRQEMYLESICHMGSPREYRQGARRFLW